MKEVLGSAGTAPNTRDKTLRKGLRILEVLAENEVLPLKRIATLSELTKGNAHHLLKTLVEEGYVLHDVTGGNYRMALKLWEISAQHYERIDVVSAAKAAMVKLGALTRETIHLAVLDGIEVVYLHKIDSPEAIRSYTKIGGRAPAHCVATGKVLLAFANHIDVLDPQYKFERFSDKTIADGATLARTLLNVRKQGYSINDGEWRGSVNGLAAPIFDIEGNVTAALGISGPDSRLTQNRMQDLAGKVLNAAASISRELGYKKHLLGEY